MRRTGLALALIVSVLGLVALAGCGGDEEATPTPTGTDTTATDTTETDTTETDTTATDTTETTTTDTGTTGQSDAAVRGKQVFLGSSACGGCHALADAGSSGTVGPNLDDTKPNFDLVVERVTNGSGAMPPFKDTLSEPQILDVAAYVVAATGG